MTVLCFALPASAFQDVITVAISAFALQDVVTVVCSFGVFAGIALAVWFAARRKPSVYCVESAVFVPPESWKVSHDELKRIISAQGCFNDDALAFQSKALERSSTGQSTHWPPASHVSKDGKTKWDATKTSMAGAREEAEAVVFPIVQEVLEKTGVSARDIDFLVVNCSLFSPTPSLCAMICHKFNLRQDVRSYNLGGMGCSANVIAVDLAKQLLQNAPGTRALVVSTEMISPNFYKGNEKSMLLQNILFRCGGAALLLSSRRSDAARAKYKLLFTERIQISDDEAHGAVVQRPDEEGNCGVALSKQIVAVAARAMKHNLTRLAPRVLPVSELARTVANRLSIYLCSKAKQAGFMDMAPPKAYVPDFTKAVEHFCIHAGGRAVLDGVQKNLGLNDNHMQASRETLFDWGNTSSSSIWYEAEWIERFGDLKKGHRILQVTFGSGFKCNSAVWSVLRVDAKKLRRPIKQQDAAPPSLLGARRAVSGKAPMKEDSSQEAKVAAGL